MITLDKWWADMEPVCPECGMRVRVQSDDVPERYAAEYPDELADGGWNRQVLTATFRCPACESELMCHRESIWFAARFTPVGA